MAAAAVAAAASVAADASVPASSIHILLVDDERLSLIVVGNLLRKCNYQVTVASSGKEAINMLQNSKPGTFHLVLTDVVMPTCSGIDLLRFIRTHESLSSLPVVMMSASEQQETVHECIQGGAADYLVKPVTRKEVQKIWTHVMKKLNAEVEILEGNSVEIEEEESVLKTHGRPPSSHQATAPPGTSPTHNQASTSAFQSPAIVSRQAHGSLPSLPQLNPAIFGFLGSQAGSQPGSQPGSSLPTFEMPSSLKVSLPGGGLGSRLGGLGLGPPPGIPEGGLGSQPPIPLQLTPPFPADQASRLAMLAGISNVGRASRIAAGDGATPGTREHKTGLLPKQDPSAEQASARLASSLAKSRVEIKPDPEPLAQASHQNGGAAQPGEGYAMPSHAKTSAGHANASSSKTDAPPAKKGGRLGGGGLGQPPVDSMNLMQWLSRPARSVQPKESFWVFCEVVLLLDNYHSQSESAVRHLRPTNMVLHSSGQMSFVPGLVENSPCGKLLSTAHPNTAPGHVVSSTPLTLSEEEQQYMSPEEVAEAKPHLVQPNQAQYPVSHKSDMYSLGVLFFELFFVGSPRKRKETLANLRLRILPPTFLMHQPKEAAFTLALLHPEPSSRPSISQLLSSDMFRDTCATLRQRHTVLAMQQLRQNKLAGQAVSAAEAHQDSQQGGQLSVPHQGQGMSAFQGQKQHQDSKVLVDFLRLMQQRKSQEMEALTSDLGKLNYDIEQVEHAMQSAVQAVKRANRTAPSLRRSNTLLMSAPNTPRAGSVPSTPNLPGVQASRRMSGKGFPTTSVGTDADCMLMPPPPTSCATSSSPLVFPAAPLLMHHGSAFSKEAKEPFQPPQPPQSRSQEPSQPPQPPQPPHSRSQGQSTPRPSQDKGGFGLQPIPPPEGTQPPASHHEQIHGWQVGQKRRKLAAVGDEGATPLNSHTQAPLNSHSQAHLNSHTQGPLNSHTRAPLVLHTQAPLNSHTQAPLDSHTQALGSHEQAEAQPELTVPHRVSSLPEPAPDSPARYSSAAAELEQAVPHSASSLPEPGSEDLGFLGRGLSPAPEGAVPTAPPSQPTSFMTGNGGGGGGSETTDSGGETTTRSCSVVDTQWKRISKSFHELYNMYIERRASGAEAESRGEAGPPGGGLGQGTGRGGHRTQAKGSNKRPRMHSPNGRHPSRGGGDVQEMYNLPEYLHSFSSDLGKYSRYGAFKLHASLLYGDQLSSAHMVCSSCFDRDDDFFAIAGVSKRIKIYELAGVLHSHQVGMHYPVLEISSRSRLSAVRWSGYIKGHLAASDYEGSVRLWDVNTNQELMQFCEHTKRVWSIDFCRVDPTRLISGSDDGGVKVWSLNQQNSAITITTKANVCSVQFNPEASHLIAFGSANHRTYMYDLRYTAQAVHVLTGHQKAVAFVRYMSGDQLVTASTDNTVKMWCLGGTVSAPPHSQGSDTGQDPASDSSGALMPFYHQGRSLAPPSQREGGAAPHCCMTYTGHTNERNFVGLSVTSEGNIACGSENNTVYCYYKAMPSPVASFHCSTANACGMLMQDEVEQTRATTASQFVSTVSWSRNGQYLLAANSVGAIKILSLV